MPPPRPPSRPKVKIGISLDAGLYEWLAARTGVGGEFASISHAIERCIAAYQRAEAMSHAAHEDRPDEHGDVAHP